MQIRVENGVNQKVNFVRLQRNNSAFRTRIRQPFPAERACRIKVRK